ncbi:hypothetical protein LEP1GSC166_0502 [Leptospira kirschneri]|nr:hypothetical protein LEP1GSC166_1642 [Leptospira kirschneri]EMK07849.1 hypothetical protein LEP1GSC166_0502 [Leptospira kirschneri]
MAFNKTISIARFHEIETDQEFIFQQLYSRLASICPFSPFKEEKEQFGLAQFTVFPTVSIHSPFKEEKERRSKDRKRSKDRFQSTLLLKKRKNRIPISPSNNFVRFNPLSF